MHKINVRREKRGLPYPNAAQLIKKAAVAALAAEGVDSNCAIDVLLTDDEGIRRLNAEFRDVDAPTDVLSFPLNDLAPGEFDTMAVERDLDSGLLLLGDMVLSLERCARQGEELEHGFERELMYLTVHSVLHLLGYDHVDEAEEKQNMREREKAVMVGVGVRK